MWKRRSWLGSLPVLWGAAMAPRAAKAQTASGAVRSLIQFPRDHGSHPDHAIEWWYLTGWLVDAPASGQPVGDADPSQAPKWGFQVTFFRSRVAATQGMQSRLAARHLLFAHASLTDLATPRMLTEQRMAREAARDRAAQADLDLQLGDWRWQRAREDAAGQERFAVRLEGDQLGLDLRVDTHQPPLLQGEGGRSRKGPQADEFSLYYTLPQLRVGGSLRAGGQRLSVWGRAWMDHEWSQQMLPRHAVGWDWIGMNLDDGSALTAFRLRRSDGQTLWDGGSFRSASGSLFRFSPGEVVFSPQRHWTSPLSRGRYPVEWVVRTPADFYTVRALVDAQEVDSRASTGAWYWEGLCALFDSAGRRVGHGYLEMTGYAHQMRMSAARPPEGARTAARQGEGLPLSAAAQLSPLT